MPRGRGLVLQNEIRQAARVLGLGASRGYRLGVASLAYMLYDPGTATVKTPGQVQRAGLALLRLGRGADHDRGVVDLAWALGLDLLSLSDLPNHTSNAMIAEH